MQAKSNANSVVVILVQPSASGDNELQKHIILKRDMKTVFDHIMLLSEDKTDDNVCPTCEGTGKF